MILASLGTALATASLDRWLGKPSAPSSASDMRWALLDPPHPPTNLQASAGDGFVDLSWTPPPVEDLVTGYNIYRGESPGGESKIASILLFTTYHDDTVTNGVTYWYYVTALNAFGESGPSNEVSATPGGSPPPTVPGPPKNLNAAAGDGTVSLTWQAPDSDGGTPIKFYHVYRATSPGQESRYADLGDVRSYTDTGVTNGQTYYYTVTAENDVGEGPWSNEASATPQAPPKPPGPPVDLRATAGDGSVQLDWSAPVDDGGSPVTNYRIYRGTTSGQLGFLVEVPDVRSYLDTTVTNGVKYFYHVTAVNSAGEGPPSNEASATPMKAPTAPDPPANLVAVGGDARVALSWQQPPSDGGSPVTNFKVYRGTSSGGESWLSTVGGDVVSYTDLAVTNGVTYFYYVTAVNAVSESGPSNEASATPATTATVPEAVRDLTAEPTDGGVRLAWSPPANDGGSPITNYKVYQGRSSGDRSTVKTLGNVTSYTDLGLVNGQRYYYVVVAVNAIGPGPPSNEVSATPATAPSAPQNVRAIGGDGVVTVQWSGPADDGGSPVTNFRIYRGTVPGGEAFVTMIGPIDSYTDEGRLNDQTYYYRVSAVNRAGEGPPSSEASATPRAGRTVPGAPPTLIAFAGNRTVRLEWTPPATDGGSPILGYIVYRGLQSDNLTQLTPVDNTTIFNDYTVTNGVKYWYEVTAVNVVGEGPRSPIASATPREERGADTTKPIVEITNPPQGAANLTAGPVTVYGNASDDTAVVRVEASADGTTWTPASGTSFWHVTLTLSAGQRTIYARAADSTGNTGDAAVNVTVKPGSGTGSQGGGQSLGNTGTMMIALAVVSFAVSAGVAWFILERRKFWGRVLFGPKPERGHLFDESVDESASRGTGPHRLR